MTFIIAEVGSNFKTLDDCKAAIGLAKKAGADAVKFQMFSKQDLFGPKFSEKPSIGSIDPDWLVDLFQCASNHNIEFMVTAFSPKGIQLVDPYVKRHKIASCENNDPEILKAAKLTKKQIIYSCGASDALSIELALKTLNYSNVVLLYCASSYPANFTKLEKITSLKKLFPEYQVGFSDHSTDFTTIPVSAARDYGAEFVEKHFNPLDLENTPDAPHSINLEQFTLMVQRVRAIHMGYYIEFDEHEVWHKAKRRVVALRDIEEKEYLDYSNIGVYRPTLQSDMIIHPHQLKSIIGKKAIKSFKCGEAIQV